MFQPGIRIAKDHLPGGGGVQPGIRITKDHLTGGGGGCNKPGKSTTETNYH